MAERTMRGRETTDEWNHESVVLLVCGRHDHGSDGRAPCGDDTRAHENRICWRARERERAPVLLCVALSGRGAPEVLFTGVRGSVHGTCARTSHRVKTARGRVARAPETECDTFRLYDTHGSAVRSPHAPHLSWAAGGTRLTDTERHERHIYVHTLYMP